MALFQVSVLKKYLKLQDEKIIEKGYRKFTSYFQHPEIQENIRKSKEEQFQATFLSELFVNILGYKLNPNPNYSLTTEFKNESNNRKADGAILQQGNALGVIELKGTNTKHLEGIRQQAFDYKANQKKCIYVITSNFEKLRFYINDATEFLEFDLFELNRDDFGLLWLCLHHDNIMNGLPLKIKEASLVEEEAITKEFYKDYSVFKRELYRDLVKKNAKELKSIRHSELVSESLEDKEFQKEVNGLEKNVKLNLFKKSQKLIDRFLFVFFAEDRGLLPPNSIHKIIQNWEMLQDMDVEQSLYDRYKIYFNYLNTGRESKGDQAEIFAYNGGLFKPDPILDMLKIDNELLLKHTKKLATYDFESQVDVNILGHIFENSLNEIESVNAEIEGADFDKQKSKRKKDGVFYTPKYITKYIVENTVGKLCEEKKIDLGFQEEEYFKGRKKRHKATLEQLLKILDDYREWLLKVTICDPACGSGAFLNQALDFLIKEHGYIDEMRGKLLGESFRFPGIENTILENNIYGVDINEESVEIARLSLWLRTAKPHRKLNDLSSNIKCGNSLIDNSKVAGDKAFKWEAEFTEVFKNGGFDVVIGNPPYVARSLDNKIKKYINENYVTAQYQIELYVAFMEKGTEILKRNGTIGFIVPNSWLKNLRMSDCRQYVYDNLNFHVIIPNLDNVFVEASVDTLIFIASKSDNADEIEIVEFKSKQPVKKHTVFQERFANNHGLIFDVEISDKILPIIRKVRTNVNEVGEIMDVIRGVNPYDKYTGQSAEVIKSRAYHADYQKDKTFVPELKGKHVSSYNYNWDREHFISYGDWLAAPRDIKYFKGQRIVFREILGEKLVSTLIEEDFIIDRSLYIAKMDEEYAKDYFIEYILGVLNSKLMAFYFRYSNNEFDTLFPKIRVAEFKKLLIRNCGRDLQKAIKSEVLTLIACKSKLINSTHKFIQFFEKNHSLKFISKKLKGWHELEFGDFIKELNKAIKKTNRERAKEGQDPVKELTKKDEFEWMELFEENKKKAMELQQQIDETDRKIDQMVYELYGLTEEEIQIVENS